MEAAIGRYCASSVCAGIASEVCESSARSFDDHLHRGEVPEGHDGLNGGVDRPLGHQHVLPEIPECPFSVDRSAQGVNP